MSQFLSIWLASAISLLITAWIVPGIDIIGIFPAAIGAIVLGFVNAIVKPILVLFTLPLTILTLGLFLLVVNAIAFSLVGYFTPNFDVNGFLPALFGSIVLSFVSGVVSQLFHVDDVR